MSLFILLQFLLCVCKVIHYGRGMSRGMCVTPQNVTIDAKCNINPKCNNF